MSMFHYLKASKMCGYDALLQGNSIESAVIHPRTVKS